MQAGLINEVPKVVFREHNFIMTDSLIKTKKAKTFICGDDLNNMRF